ncbi:MAG TPA: amidase [Frankiaceae bacterium]|nr:amidase [Frankiaceae bacterium]
MATDDLCWLTLTEAADRIAAGALSPVELTRAVLARIERLDPALHAYLTLRPEAALQAARDAEAEIAAGRRRGALHGIPVAVKDLCDLRGTVTTCASRVLDERPAAEDATCVARLAAAGAVIVGKTNLTEFALMGYHPTLPIPLNPWAADRSVGGSSSGSGVAVAAGLCMAALGTDTGGSIRIPSSWCGTVGLKPTYGRVSRAGIFPLGASLDHIGPLARTVADAAHVLDALAGADPRDPTARRQPPPGCAAALGGDLRGVRIGWDEAYATTLVLPAVTDAVYAAVEALGRLGAEVVRVRVPPVDEVVGAWPVLCGGDALAAHRPYFPGRAAAYGPSFRTFLEYASGLTAADYAARHEQRLNWAGAFAATLEACDVLACPSTFMPPPPADALDPYGEFSDAIAPFMRFTAPFNFSGSPTLSIPCGFTEDGLPHSLQLVGPHGGEALLCRVGHAYQMASDWHRRRPPLPS